MCSFGGRSLILTDEPCRGLVGPQVLVVKPFRPELAAKVLEIFLSLEQVQRLYVSPVFNDSLSEAFRASCDCIEAAGGLVVSPSGELLLIYRRGVWDLPKGKVEPGEIFSDTAIREVREETGLSDLRVLGTLLTTDHIYIEGDRRILKSTHWFLLEWGGRGEVHPQAEEDIREVAFFAPQEAFRMAQATFPSVERVISRYLALDRE